MLSVLFLVVLQCDQMQVNKTSVQNEWLSGCPATVILIVVYGRQATIHDSKYGTIRVLFASTYTAKQMKTMYYSLIIYFCISPIQNKLGTTIKLKHIVSLGIQQALPKIIKQMNSENISCVPISH